MMRSKVPCLLEEMFTMLVWKAICKYAFSPSHDICGKTSDLALKKRKRIWKRTDTCIWTCIWKDTKSLCCTCEMNTLLINYVCVCVLVAQSCPTLCNPMDCSPPGSSVHGILQARYWSWLPFPSPGDLPNLGIKPRPPTLQAGSLPSEPHNQLYSNIKFKK